MSVRAHARKQPDSYFQLVRRFPLTVIEDDAHLDRAVLLIDKLLDLAVRDRGQRAYLDALTTLVESYEAERIPMPSLGGAAILRNLIADNGITQAELARA